MTEDILRESNVKVNTFKKYNKQDVSKANVKRIMKSLNLHLYKILVAYKFNLVVAVSASFNSTELCS
jgi:hypothetical protein